MPHFGELASLTGMEASSFTPAVSPYSYTASRSCVFNVTGGTVSLIEYMKGTGAYATTGVASGPFDMAAGDSIRVTFTVAPAIKLLQL